MIIMSVSPPDGEEVLDMRSDANPKFQFLNSVISSIGSKDGSQPKALPTSSQPSSEVVGDAQFTPRDSGPLVTTKTVPFSQKRKAKDALPRSNEKVSKTVSYRGSSSMLSTQMKSQQPLHTTKPASASTNVAIEALPDRGINRTPTLAPLATSAPKLPPPDGMKAPKKGSFAEIMARAKAAQEAPPVVGAIRHQPKDKKALSHKKELMLQKKSNLGRRGSPGRNGHSRNSSSDVSNGSASKLADRNGAAHTQKTSEIAKTLASSKPQPTYKGTMGLNKPASQPSQEKPIPQPRIGRPTASRYQYYDHSERDESEVEEEGGGYSDESDDMEAGFDDVEEEETKATKMARKEDEEEARMEAELKRQKEARKKRLQELAKKQQAKKPIY